MSSTLPVITELDAARIRELGARLPGQGQGFDSLENLIDMVTGECEIVPGGKVPPDVVTVNSKVSFRDELTGAVHTVTVVYPQDFSIPERRISVLSPVGRALLGRRVGRVASFGLPDGTTREIRIMEVHYQPEASGDLTR